MGSEMCIRDRAKNVKFGKGEICVVKLLCLDFGYDMLKSSFIWFGVSAD